MKAQARTGPAGRQPSPKILGRLIDTSTRRRRLREAEGGTQQGHNEQYSRDNEVAPPARPVFSEQRDGECACRRGHEADDDQDRHRHIGRADGFSGASIPLARRRHRREFPTARETETMWAYDQSTSTLTHNGKFRGTGYSGAGRTLAEGRNNGAMDTATATGSVSRGRWRIGAPRTSQGLGPLVMNLEPVGHDAHGRSLFRIHGKNAANNASQLTIRPPRFAPGRPFVVSAAVASLVGTAAGVAVVPSSPDATTIAGLPGSLAAAAGTRAVNGVAVVDAAGTGSAAATADLVIGIAVCDAVAAAAAGDLVSLVGVADASPTTGRIGGVLVIHARMPSAAWLVTKGAIVAVG